MCDPMIVMVAGSGMKNIQALIPIVGSGQGRMCGRDHTPICLRGRTCVWEMWSNILRTEKERESHKEYNSINKICNSYKWTTTTFTKGYKVTLYSDSLRATAFMLITQMAQTWALKEDSVNTSIRHWYSTRWAPGSLRGESWHRCGACDENGRIKLGHPNWHRRQSDGTLKRRQRLDVSLVGRNRASWVPFIAECSFELNNERGEVF